MDKQEKIVCACIKCSAVVFHNGKQHVYTENIPCIDYRLGEYLCRHFIHSIESDFPEVISRTAHKLKIGFITSKNRFVDAKEAMRIAVEENQIEAIRKAFDAIPNFHDKGIDSHEFGEAANAAIDIRDDYLSRELKPEDLY